MPTRREFLKLGIAATAAGAASQVRWPRPAYASFQVAQTALNAVKAIPKYVDPLPVFGPAGPIPRVDGTLPVTVSAHEIQQQILPAGFPATTVWAYKVGNSLPIPLYPGVSIEAKRGIPTNVTYINNLPVTGSQIQKLLSFDQSVHWAMPTMDPMTVKNSAGVVIGNPKLYDGPPPMVAHLHGAEVLSDYDGGPDAWFTPDGLLFGSAYRTFSPPPVPNACVYHYTNEQEATTLWFHDHTLGATRLNVYAGMAAFYLLRDQYDTGVEGTGLNLPGGAYEIELALQDKQFDTNGQLLFPDGYPAGLNGAPAQPLIHPYWIPEFFGDAIVVNGKTWPYLNVQPRRYRFRLLDGCNARLLELYLLNPATGLPGPDIFVIGDDGGLLDTPARIRAPKNRLLMAPGERYDVIIDFSAFKGQTLVMQNTAKAPYPGGANPDPNGNGQILQFRVANTTVTDTSFNPAATGANLRKSGSMPPIVRLADPVAGTVAANVTPQKTRQLVLVEIEGPAGPVQVMVNNTCWDGTMAANGSTPANGGTFAVGGNWISENPQIGSTEIWEIVNLTMDAHPIHTHLTQFQLINRQPFQVKQYRALYDSLFPAGTFPGVIGAKGPTATWGPVVYPGKVFIPAYGPPLSYDGGGGLSGKDAWGNLKFGGNPDVTPFLNGAIMPPKPEEAGWKDTVQMYPGQVSRIVVRWQTQSNAVNAFPAGDVANSFTFDPTYDPTLIGNAAHPGYVWHCHIVDHEDNEMMRPYIPVK